MPRSKSRSAERRVVTPCPKCGGPRVLHGIKRPREVCPPCTRERQRQYREENLEKVRERRRQYRKENREKARERQRQRQRQYHAENREKEIERQRKYREENREKVREYQRQYHAENREKARERRRRYRKENPEKVRERKANRRARKKNSLVHAGIGKARVFRESEGHCVYCNELVPKENGARHLEHVIPLSHEAGLHAIGNLVASCGPCNHKKTTLENTKTFVPSQMRTHGMPYFSLARFMDYAAIAIQRSRIDAFLPLSRKLRSWARMASISDHMMSHVKED